MIVFRYFRKFNPKTVIYLNNGSHVQFDTLDNLMGYYATQNEYIQQQFDECVRGQRGGIIEITAEEFERDYAQKKRNSPDFRPPPLKREELAAPTVSPDTISTTRNKGAAQPAQAPSHTPYAMEGSDIRRPLGIAPMPPLPPPPPPAPQSASTAQESQPTSPTERPVIKTGRRGQRSETVVPAKPVVNAEVVG